LGVRITPRASAWEQADFIVKVKQPFPEEFKYFRSGRIIAAFHHLAANLPLLECALNTDVTLIDYGTIQDAQGSTHILAEMSKLAGRSAIVDGEYLLEKHRGKILMPGTKAAIIGMGNAGIAAAERILPTGAMLYCFDIKPEALERAKNRFSQFSPYQVWYLKYNQADTKNQQQLAAILTSVDLLIGCTHEFAKHTDKPVPEWVMARMPKNSVAEDISIDQGGCFATSEEFFRNGKQTFRVHGVIHRCVPNIPGKISRVATPILCQETFPYIKDIAQKGLARAVRENPVLASGVAVHKGRITCRALAEDENVNRMDRYRPLSELLKLTIDGG